MVYIFKVSLAYRCPALLTKHNPLQSPTRVENKVLLWVFGTLVAGSHCWTLLFCLWWETLKTFVLFFFSCDIAKRNWLCSRCELYCEWLLAKEILRKVWLRLKLESLCVGNNSVEKFSMDHWMFNWCRSCSTVCISGSSGSDTGVSEMCEWRIETDWYNLTSTHASPALSISSTKTLFSTFRLEQVWRIKYRDQNILKIIQNIFHINFH